MPRVSRFGVAAFYASTLALLATPPGSSTGSIRAKVVSGDPPTPVVSASVTLVGTAIAAMTGTAGTAVLSGVAAGQYTLRVLVSPLAPCVANVTVTEGTETAIVVNVSACSDRLVTNEEKFTALLDLRGASAPGTCTNDRVIDGVNFAAEVQPSALSNPGGGVTCHAAGWVFSEDHAPYFASDPAVFPWSDAEGDVVTVALPASRLRVPMTLWIADPSLDVPSVTAIFTTTYLPAANAWLRASRSGLRLTKDEATDDLPELVDVGTLIDPGTGAPPYPAIGNGCDHTMSIIANPVAYRRGHLNVYLVSKIEGSGIPAGRHCGEQGAANVMFVDPESVDTTLIHLLLLHEAGHALGLSRPDNGHADLAEGLFQTNLMWSTLASVGGDVPDHLSLGQLARLHASVDSWLNLPSDAFGGTVRTRQASLAFTLTTSCGCPSISATDDCPALHTDVARSGPANPPPSIPPACRVTVDQSCLSLAPSAVASFTANGWADAGSTLGMGSASVASTDVSVATVVKTTESPGLVRAKVTAGALPGSATILVSLGGNIVPVPVKVGASC